MIASYEKALYEITEYRQRFIGMRAQYARDTEYYPSEPEGRR